MSISEEQADYEIDSESGRLWPLKKKVSRVIDIADIADIYLVYTSDIKQCLHEQKRKWESDVLKHTPKARCVGLYAVEKRSMAEREVLASLNSVMNKIEILEEFERQRQDHKDTFAKKLLKKNL